MMHGKLQSGLWLEPRLRVVGPERQQRAVRRGYFHRESLPQLTWMAILTDISVSTAQKGLCSSQNPS